MVLEGKIVCNTCPVGGECGCNEDKFEVVTYQWMKNRRRMEWETKVGWNVLVDKLTGKTGCVDDYEDNLVRGKEDNHICTYEDNLDRIISSLDVNKEDLQNFEVPMVIVGCDVTSLYPSMKIDRIIEQVREAVKIAKITWREIDYLEALRYIALNSTAEEFLKMCFGVACHGGGVNQVSDQA